MTYTVAVRELCEFTAKQGDLDLRFTPAPTALEGMAGLYGVEWSPDGTRLAAAAPLATIEQRLAKASAQSGR